MRKRVIYLAGQMSLPSAHVVALLHMNLCERFTHETLR
jgi:hypothetical protein